MNKKTGFLGLGILSILVIGSFSFSVFAQDLPSLIIESKDNSNSAKFVPGQVIVGLEKPDPNFNAKASLHGGEVISSIDQIKAHVVKVPINSEDKFISAISKNPNVRYVERDFIMTSSFILNDPPITPFDPIYPVQWGMKRIGMELVWPDTFDLGSGIIVAVVDTGMYPEHPDLLGTNILTNSDWDFVDGDNDTEPTTICIDQYGIRAESHATTVAGVIAAATNNGEGVAGIGKFDILPVRVLNQCGSGSSSNVASGIIHAALKGAHVINLSLGSPEASIAIQDAIVFARADPTNAVVVAASGNLGNGDISYPAGDPNVISVGATSSDDTIASYSQYGNTTELSAPGGTSEPNCQFPATTFIVTTGIGLDGAFNPIYQYSCVTGTSFAAPHVSGVAALVRDQYQERDSFGNFIVSNDDIRLHLQETADDLGSPNYDIYFGHGLVRADLALSTPIGSVVTDTTPPVITLNPPNLQIIEVGDPYVELNATATDDVDGDISDSIVIDSTGVDTSAVGNYQVTYNVMDAAENPATQVNRTVTVEDNTPVDPVTVHVDMTGSVSGKKNLKYNVTITVSDESNATVSDVEVKGDWLNESSSSTCMTNSLGICFVTHTTKVTPLTFSITSLLGNNNESLNTAASSVTSLEITKDDGGSGGGGGPGKGGGNDGGDEKPCNPKKPSCPTS